MSRSLKKGPYINVKLEKRILAMNESGKKVVVKTWASKADLRRIWIIFSLGIRIRMHFCINIDLSPKNTLKLGDKR